MSVVFEGKISNQSPKYKIENDNTFCSKCNKQISAPELGVLNIKDDKEDTHRFWVNSYLFTSHYIYESKSGKAVCYCSDYCRRKHNHRFKKDV